MYRINEELPKNFKVEKTKFKTEPAMFEKRDKVLVKQRDLNAI